MTAASHPMLQAKDVKVSLGGRQVLGGVSLSVQAGEWLTLVGPNGAGKSVLLASLAGLTNCSGEVSCGGAALAPLSVRERSTKIAYVPQQPAKPVAMTVGEYVLLGRTPHIRPLGTEGPADHEACDAALERLDLSAQKRRTLDTLSGGELQRCFLARAIAQDTPVVILDEPTTALDIGHEQQALQLVDELRAERRLTIVTAMHDLNAAAHYSQRLVLLSQGEVVASGDPEQVLTAQRLRDIYGATVEVLHRDGNLVLVPQRPETFPAKDR